jgi:hypothetical protein
LPSNISYEHIKRLPKSFSEAKSSIECIFSRN